jgi:fatty-acyl-CoA synthase
MSLQARVQREFKFIRALIRTLRRVGSISSQSGQLVCDDLEDAVDAWRERPAISFEGATLSYGELDALANRYAHWAIEHGLRRGHTVALFMANRPDYLAVWYGLSKVGVATALINNNLVGEPLAHCLNISGASQVIADTEGAAPIEAIRTSLQRPATVWVLGEAHGEQRDLANALKSCSALRPGRTAREDILAGETALYIYTSGTTGPPKAARVTHVRAQLYMRGFAAATNARESDRVYITLPMYHATGGLCATGAVLLAGGSMVLKTRFSASGFWADVNAEGCTMFVYIGELCRYLLNQPVQPGEQTHALRMAFGNGLRPEVWDSVKTRFALPEILEFYGSTEGNVSLFNFDGKPGAIGRVPPYVRSRFNVRLVRFDVETEAPMRGDDGLCQEPAPGEVGECIGEIRSGDPRAEFAGYADKAASEKKILRDVFEPGDAWFATGDLMRQDEEGYFYFVDRVGDTFRWKGENVSTSEVADQLSTLPGVKEATVYGVRVEGQDGRAGMASLVVGPQFDITAFAAAADAGLAAYARPVFVRLQPEIETTGTFKYRKLDLVAEGFDPSVIRQPLYVRDPAKGYVKLTKAVFARIQSGGLRL